jgi:hypothetical protein
MLKTQNGDGRSKLASNCWYEEVAERTETIQGTGMNGEVDTETTDSGRSVLVIYQHPGTTELQEQ